jgi:hypothetical protein
VVGDSTLDDIPHTRAGHGDQGIEPPEGFFVSFRTFQGIEVWLTGSPGLLDESANALVNEFYRSS